MSELTPDQIEILARMADHYAAGHRTMIAFIKLMVTLGGIVMFFVTLAYFFVGTIKDWPVGMWPR